MQLAYQGEREIADLPCYEAIPGFEQDIAIEYGFLQAIYWQNSCLCFALEVLLSDRHADYAAPPPDAWACLAQRWLCFSNVRDVAWANLRLIPQEGALGENYAFWPEFDAYHFFGEWGECHVAAPPPRLLRDAQEFIAYRHEHGILV